LTERRGSLTFEFHKGGQYRTDPRENGSRERWPKSHVEPERRIDSCARSIPRAVDHQSDLASGKEIFISRLKKLVGKVLDTFMRRVAVKLADVFVREVLQRVTA
jgi:hypothetical protein